MLALPAEIERKPGTQAAAPEHYIDLSYYEAALKRAGP